MKIIVWGCLIAQMKCFDALITTQKTQALCEKMVIFEKWSFWVIFLDFFRNGTSQRAGVFLRCNQCIKTLRLSYQTSPYDDFNFLGHNGFLHFFRPLVAGVKHQIFCSRKIFSVFLWHKAYKITRVGNLSLISREM